MRQVGNAVGPLLRLSAPWIHPQKHSPFPYPPALWDIIFILVIPPETAWCGHLRCRQGEEKAEAPQLGRGESLGGAGVRGSGGGV